jgi:hypothetical protein
MIAAARPSAVATVPPTALATDVALPAKQATVPSDAELEVLEDGLVQVGFSGSPPKRTIELDVLPLTQLPSAVAADKLRKFIAGRQEAKDLFGSTHTRINRLLHIQLFSAETAYEEHSDETLLENLAHSKEKYRDADAYYEHEVRAHRLEHTIKNNSEHTINDGFFELKIPQLAGLGVSDKIYTENGGESPYQYAYPKVTTDAYLTVLRTGLSKLAAGAQASLYRQPPRIWVREEAAGQTIELRYEVRSSALPAPVMGTLRMHIAKLR